MLKNVLTNSDNRKDREAGRTSWEKELGRMVWERGIFLLSLMRASSMSVRLIAIKVYMYTYVGWWVDVLCRLNTNIFAAS